MKTMKFCTIIRKLNRSDLSWLSSNYGQELLHKFVCGSVVSHLEKEHILQVSVPLLRDENAQREINDTVLDANQKRTEAYNFLVFVQTHRERVEP